MAALLAENRPLPFALEGAAIYYAGPTPARAGAVCGSFGPTTSGRMDAFAPALYDRGLSATIGKGNRSAAVVEAIRRNRAVYLVAIGGAGAIAARHIASLEEIAFPELGCESVKRLVFSDFPLIVGIDCAGGNIYERGKD
ncbi:MAG: fumarate hydratase C-terminal domain-containing protein [Acutalibacteraceae bacterium]